MQQLNSTSEYDSASELDNMLKLEDSAKVDPVSYNGYTNWVIISDILETRTFNPTVHFLKMVQEQLEIDRSKFNITILNHSINDQYGKFWIVLTVGITPIKKQKKF